MTEPNALTPPSPEPVAGPVNTDQYGGSLTQEEAVQKAAADFRLDPDVLRN